MADPFLGEIKIVGFNYAPKSWAMCNGQFLPINQNQALFSLLGTTYGGNGQTTFALPDLRGRVPLHFSNATALGTKGGQEAHTVTQGELPAHTHVLNASSLAQNGVATPNGNFLGGANNAYLAPAALTTMEPSSVTSVGGSQPHTNLQPFLTLTFCIALIGVFPSRN